MQPKEARKIPKALWLVAIVFAGLANFSEELLQAGNSGLFISSAIAAFVVYKVTLWADAYEHETRQSLIFTGIFGCGVSVLVAIFLYELIPGSSDSNFVVALIEESSKALVLLPLIRLRYINSWTDGLVFGSMAGLGFSITEDFMYALGSEDPLVTIIGREIYSIFGHSVFSAFLFAAICAAYLHSRKSIFLVMLTLSIGTHWLWNSGVGLIEGGEFIVYAVIPPVTFVLLAVFLRSQEKSELKLLGKKLIELGHLTEEELDLAANLKQRKRYRRTLDTSAQKEEFDKKISADVRKILGTIQTQSPS
jgi:RsiW-degrading membrane proteinase PrsW (M82 family)